MLSQINVLRIQKKGNCFNFITQFRNTHFLGYFAGETTLFFLISSEEYSMLAIINAQNV